MTRHLPWLAAAVTAAVYAPCIGGGFVHWDDPEWIVGNPVVNGGASFAAIWTTFVHHTWYPLYGSALRLLWSAGDGAPWVFHATSVAGFALAAGLWAAILRRLGFGPTGCAVAVALFALHPLRVESVAWASALRDVLSLDLCLAALWLWLGRGPARWLAVAAFAGAVMAKSMVFALAPLPLLIDLLWLDRPRRRAAAAAVPFGAVGLAGAVVAWFAYRPISAINGYPAGDLVHSLPVIGAIQLRYLRLQLWPADLAALPSTPAGGAVGHAALAGLAALAVVAVILALRGRRGPALAAAAYTLPMLPVAGLVPLSFPVADRYTLLPSLALCAAVGWWGQRLTRPVLALIGVAAVALVACTACQQRHWHDSEALWRHSLQHFPREPAAHQNLAAGLGAQGRMAEAVFELEVALWLADGAEPDSARLVELLLLGSLLQHNVPLEHAERWRERFRGAATDGEGLTALATEIAGANLAAPAEVVLRRCEVLGTAPDRLALARATYEARAGRWWPALGHADRGLSLAPRDPQLLALKTLALLGLGGPEAARPTAAQLASGIEGLDADGVLAGLAQHGLAPARP